MGVLVGVVLILFAFNCSVYGETFPECDGVEREAFVAATNDCESYIFCDDEESFVSKCEENQRFNAELGICDEPENVECLSEETTSAIETPKPSKPPIISSTETNSKTSPRTSTTATTTTVVSSSTASSNLSIDCPTPSKPDEVIYLPSSESCSQYFMCVMKTPISMTCPLDLEFNTLTSTCDFASSSNCKIIGTTTSSPRERCSDVKAGYFEYVNNCHYYYRCMNGLLTIQECPQGFGWDSRQKKCTSTACK